MNKETTEQVSVKEGVRGIWRHSKPFKSKLIFISILGFFSAAANGAVPYVTGRFFDSLINLSQGVTFEQAGFPLWALILSLWALIQLIANGSDWVMDRSRRTMDTYSQLGVQVEGFTHLLQLPLSYHTNEHINGVLSKISMASWRISSIIRAVIEIAPQLLSVFIGVILAASISVPMAGVLVLGVVLYIALLATMLRSIAAVDHEAHEAWNNSWNDAAAAVQQAAAVKQAVAETYEIAKVRTALMGRTAELWNSMEIRWSDIGFYQRFIVFLTQLTIFVASVASVINGSMTVGDLIALNGYAMLFFGPFVSLGYSWQIIQNGLTSAGQLERVFQTRREEYHPRDAKHPDKRIGHVAFDQVSFRYADDQEEVLNNVSFAVDPGQMVALVGESGGGKSTTISLISGYYFPTAGTVRVDGIDTRNSDLVELRKEIAVVPQEVALFNESIRDNIRYGSFDASEQAIVHAAQEAHIADFIASLPQGYDTLVGERGIKLSVGQKQRIAIARAILRDPKILILDEPTSALDSETERLVTGALEKLMRGRTTFIIAHRLSTVRKADKILVLKDGQIAEEGRHEDLIQKTGGIYRHLYELHIGLRD